LKKREEFAVNLRKKKTTEIISAKRRRLIGVYQEDAPGDGHVQT
jgi:ferredoxin-like protein FixX